MHADIAILVTHMEYAMSFPQFVGRRDLGVNFPLGGPEKGEGVILDYQAKTLRLV